MTKKELIDALKEFTNDREIMVFSHGKAYSGPTDFYIERCSKVQYDENTFEEDWPDEWVELVPAH